MDKNEAINEETTVSSQEDTTQRSIVIDIEQGTAYDMDKDFKQVGKTTLYYIILQFCLAFVLVFIVTATLISSIMATVDIGSSTSLTSTDSAMAEYVSSSLKWVTITSAISALLSGWLVVRSAKKKLKIDKAELFRKNPWDFAMIIKFSVIAMGVSMIASFAVMGLDFLMNMFGLKLTTPDFSLTSDVISNIFMLLSVLIIAPIFEELICRGIILRSLQRYNTRFAIIVSSIIFGLLHMNFIQGLPAFAMGVVFAYVSVKSNSVIPSIIMHFINNAFAVLASALIGSFAFAEVGFLVVEILMMCFAVYYIFSHRMQFSQDEDLMISARGYYSRFFNCWPNIVLIVICSMFTLLSFVYL